MDSSAAFGKILKKWRMARDLTQNQLADLCLLDRTFISMMERGRRQPSLKTILVVSEKLKVAPEELIRQTVRLSKVEQRKGRNPFPSRKL